MRVSTSGMNAVLLAQTMDVQARYNEALAQQSSGLKSSSLSGLDGLAGTMVSLSSDLSASEHLTSQAEAAQSSVEVAYGALGSMVDILTAAQADITAAIDGTTDTTDTLKRAAASWLDDIADLMNTDFAGAYVFAGAGGSTAPVDLNDAAYDPLADPATADSAYYQGSAAGATLMVDGGNGLDYGITADDAAFEQALRGLSMLADMTTDPVDLTALQDAYDLLDDAISGMGAAQETLSTQSDRLSTLIDQQTEFQLFAESALANINEVDVAQATVKASEEEVVLQASYSALSSFLNLSLMDYL